MTMSTAAQTTRGQSKPIGRMLIDEGLISAEQLKEALERQQKDGGKTVELLIRLGHLRIEDVAEFLARRPGVASIELDHYAVPEDLIALVPRAFAEEHEVFPIDRLGTRLTVAMAFPIDLNTIAALSDMTSMQVGALLCHAMDIREAIRRYYPSDDAPQETIQLDRIETGLRMENIAALVRQIDSLPTLAETVQRVQEAMADPDTSLRDIADVVSSDPPISAKLLQLANSAAYGFLSRINSVQSAITLLGMRETYMAVLSSAIIDLTEKANGFDHEAYWRSSEFCAAAARKIATAAGEGRNPSPFTAGLLLDIGRFALSQVAGSRYAQIDPSLRGQALVEAEERALGIGHPEAGHILATHWRLPEDIATAIRFHHRPELATEHERLAAFAALASEMTDAHAAGLGADEAYFAERSAVLDACGIDAATATDVYLATRTPEMMEAR